MFVLLLHCVVTHITYLFLCRLLS